MSLISQIEKDYITAYKAKEQDRVDAIRLLKTSLTKMSKELKRELNDGEALDVIAKEVKQRKDSITQYQDAGRDDLAAKEITELNILQQYMPQQLSAEELAEVVTKTISELDASGMKDMGKVMKSITGAYKGQVDGKALSDLVRAKLTG